MIDLQCSRCVIYSRFKNATNSRCLEEKAKTDSHQHATKALKKGHKEQIINKPLSSTLNRHHTHL